MGYLKTSIMWHDSRGGECEAYVGVRYTGQKGFRGDHIDPPEPATVEIDEIKVIEGCPLPDDYEATDELIDECLADWAEEAAEAEEWRAQSRRDQLMGGF